MWERVERPLLREIFARYGGSHLDCLDFACGTGRITELLQSEFGQVTGLDISPDMLTEARTKCPGATFVCGNLLAQPELVGKFDVITSFRFFPNAEPTLRRQALQALVPHLKPGGVVIVNNHQNSASLLGVLRRLRGSTRAFMAPETMPELLGTAGLAVTEQYGFGKIPVWRDWSLVPARWIAYFERRSVTRDSHVHRDLNIVYVARQE
jgi:SAM-dependent methyltransferase